MQEQEGEGLSAKRGQDGEGLSAGQEGEGLYTRIGRRRDVYKDRTEKDYIQGQDGKGLNPRENKPQPDKCKTVYALK